MQIINIVLLFLAMLLISAVMHPFAKKVKLPYSLVLVIAGFVGSELVTYLGYDTGLRWQHFHHLVFYIFLPALVFESALHIDARSLLKKLLPILILSTPMMLLVTLISATMLFFGIGYPNYYPFLAALLTGALLSATDPAAVLDLFKQAGVSEKLILLMDGESLLNDAVAIMLFGLFSGLLLMPDGVFTLSFAAEQFAIIFFGGVLMGAVTLLLFGGLYLLIKDGFSRMIFMLSAAYGGYIVAESLLHVSGVICVLVAGLGFGELMRRQTEVDQQENLSTLWGFGGELANSMIFVLLGVTITLTMFEQQWLAMLIGIAAVLIARATGLILAVPMINLLPGTQISWKDQAVLYWGGVRGAVTIALALSLPLELESWFTIQSIAYGVVLFSLCVQATTTPLLIKKLNL
ncbi:sodium:proton antiporter [uncultured Neptuniibacter sp.]|uniref:cation:proton antiporter n=1 Tax=uncultured Neptuniibacter sp. TaxID=502143 RepID=UPI00261B1AC7|nr:sodium:proton antiporter [uncultured Neptuniibacter sp.]